MDDLKLWIVMLVLVLKAYSVNQRLKLRTLGLWRYWSKRDVFRMLPIIIIVHFWMVSYERQSGELLEGVVLSMAKRRTRSWSGRSSILWNPAMSIQFSMGTVQLQYRVRRLGYSRRGGRHPAHDDVASLQGVSIVCQVVTTLKVYTWYCSARNFAVLSFWRWFNIYSCLYTEYWTVRESLCTFLFDG